MAVAALAAIPYANSLGNGFTFDDVAIVAENPRIRSLGGAAHAFADDWWSGRRPQSLLYRPLTTATFTLDYAVAQRSLPDRPPARLPDSAARAFHVQNVLWHAAAGAAFFLLVLAMFSDPVLAVAASALFAVHPVHTEAVDGIVGRAELMSAAFGLGALAVARRSVSGGATGIGRSAAAGALTFAALLSKEQAIVLPAVPLFWLAAMPADERREAVRGRGFRGVMSGMGVAIVAYFALRAGALGSPVATGAAERTRIVIDNPIAEATGAARVLTPVRVFGEALRVLVYPRTLSADYSFDQIPLVHGLDAATALSGAALVATIAGAFALRRRAPVVSFGLALFLVTWVLTSNLFLVIGTIFGERLLYLCSAGVVLAAAWALIAAGRGLKAPRAGIAAVAVLVVLLGARTYARNRDWKDNATLFAAAASASPRSCKALDGHASALYTAGRFEEAVPLSRAALEIQPAYPGAHQTLAKSLRAIANGSNDPGRKAALRMEAEEHAQQLVTIYTGSKGDAVGLADAWNLLGSLALDEAAAPKALEAYDDALAAKPDFVPALVGSGAALVLSAGLAEDPASKAKLESEAVSRFERALALDPGNAEATKDLAMIRGGDAPAAANLHGLHASQLLKENRLDEALHEFREAARLEPKAARGFLGVGTVLVTQAARETDARRKAATIDEAIATFEHALTLEPGNASAHLNLAVTLMSYRKDPARVARELRAYLDAAPDAPQKAQMEETIKRMEQEAARGAGTRR